MREESDVVNMQGMSVISDHCCGRVLPGTKSGRQTMLSSKGPHSISSIISQNWMSMDKS